MESIPIGLLDRQRVKTKTASYDPENTVLYSRPNDCVCDSPRMLDRKEVSGISYAFANINGKLLLNYLL